MLYSDAMKRLALVFVLAAGALSAQQWGDPPYLTEDGWTPLLNGKDLTGWHAMDPAKPHDWLAVKGVGWDHFYSPKSLRPIGSGGDRIMNGAKGNTQNWVSDEKFGDMELYIEFMVARGSNSGVYLMGLYEIQILDTYGLTELGTGDCGAIYHYWVNNGPVGGSPPRVNAARQAGEWQSYQVWFRAPRFDASGKKIENAKFLKVLHNGITVQENFEVTGGTRAHMEIPEAPTNPLMLQGDHGPIAFKSIYWRPLRPVPYH
jgi:hypothetical protein